MDVTMPQLRMLMAVAAHGTIAEAAAVLGYTPSAVSQQMSALSRVVEAPVLERIGRNVRLTDVGRALVTRAAAILGEVEAARSAVEQLRHRVAGVVWFSYVESMTASIVVPLIASIRSDLPDLELRTIEEGVVGGFGDVQSGRVDIATVIDDGSSSDLAPDGIVVEWLLEERVRLVVPESMPGAGQLGDARGEVDLASMADQPFVLSSPVLLCGRLSWSACRRAGFEPRVEHHVDVYPIVLQLVAAGVGVSLVPDLALGTACPPGVRVFDLGEPITRRVGVAYRTSSADRPALAAVLERLRTLLGGRSIGPCVG